ncbi:MAG: N,N-dimethylformamidase beta subunit family domain-containing protein [Caldilineaceae bacterium]
MPKPVLTDYVTILTKENMEPLFELAWGVFKNSGEDAVANTPAEGRAALDVYSKAEIDALLANLGDIGTLPTVGSIIPSTSLLSFSAFTDAAPAAQTVTITNGGDFPLNFTVSDDAAWLTVAPTTGTDGTVLTISCAAQANAGTNNATITITDAAASNSPQTIAVNYVVSAVADNPIVAENQNSASAMSLTTADYGDIANQGFATEQSVNVGETINFKVHGDCQTIDIFRCGYYGGGVYRKVATISNTPTSQPAAVPIPDAWGATTCAGWSVTASWAVPADAVSGMYIAVVRNAALNAFSNIVFFVREDARAADIVVKVSDSTWGAAYNCFNTMGDTATIESGASLYGIGYLGNITTRSTQVSFDRPLITRNKIVNHPYNYELALVSFLEEQGYNVKYVTCYDLDINRGIGTPKVLINAGHDEYWSQNMRDRVIALQNAGTHILWMSANDIFWRIRYLNSRVIECYKDTMDGPGGHVGGTPLDPTSWTGTWRDTRWASRNPESELHGTLFRMNGIYNYNAVIPTNPYGKHPLWRGTAVESNDTTLTAHIGFEANTYDPPSQMLVGRAATTLININGAYANDDGQFYDGNGNLDWAIVVSRYQPTQGVNVSFASMNWLWGLSNDQLGQLVENVTTRQATVNLLADVGVAAATLTAGLTNPAPLPLNYYGVGNPALPNVGGGFDYFTDFRDDWAVATAYAASDVVVNRWRTFEAISGHTSAISTEPGVGASWQSVWREVNPVLAPPDVAVIVLDRTSLTFSALPNVDPGTQTITVSNSGETPLSFTVSDNAPWLTVTPTSGTDGTVLTVSCVAQSVEDNYTGTITITDPNAANSPKTVAVTYTVVSTGPSEVFFVGDPTPPNTGNDGIDYTLGMVFYSLTASGQVTAIRAYRPAGADSGVTLTGSIWSESGTLLGSATFGDTTAGGWFEAPLSAPVSIAAATNYVVGVSPIRTYAYESSYFSGAAFVTNGENLYVDSNGGRLVNPPGFPTTAVTTAFFVGVRFVAD